jgi:hypothetical protein
VDRFSHQNGGILPTQTLVTCGENQQRRNGGNQQRNSSPNMVGLENRMIWGYFVTPISGNHHTSKLYYLDNLKELLMITEDSLVGFPQLNAETLVKLKCDTQ